VSIRTLIVDDDERVRESLRRLLADHGEVDVVGECSSGREALEWIDETRPHLLFLGVRLPELDGLEVARQLGDRVFPVIVLVTENDEHAVQAFEVGAADFLVRPFDRVRLQRSLGRVREDILAKQCLGRSQNAEAVPSSGSGEAEGGANGKRSYPERFAVKSKGRIVFLKTHEVRWIEAAGNYVRLHVEKDDHLLRATMSATEEWLDPERFLRIHRSIIVNLEYVEEIKPWFHGEFAVVLRDGTRLNLSRTYRHRLEAFLDLCPG